MPYFSIHTPILIVGRNICRALRPLMDGIGYGPDVVTYAETVGDGRVRAQADIPSIAIIDVDAADGVVPELIQELRVNSPNLHVIALGSADCACADQRLPWPVSESAFFRALTNATLDTASRAVAMRGDYLTRRDQT